MSVNVTLLKKGCLKNNAIICKPNVSDFSKLDAPVEPLKIDENQSKRKEIRDAHQLLLKSGRRKRKNARKNGKVIFYIVNFFVQCF